MKTAKQPAPTPKVETTRAWAERYFIERGSTLAFAEDSGAEVVNAAQAKAEGIYPPGDGILFLYPQPNEGEPFPTKRLRYRVPPIIDGKERRHQQPKDTPPEAFYAFTQPWPSIRKNTTFDLHFVEGEADSLGANYHDFVSIGIGGVSSYGGPELLPSLQLFEWRGRHVYPCPDSDYKTKPEVQRATVKLAAALTARGAIVHIVEIPNVMPPAIVDGRAVPGKTGLGDFLAKSSAHTKFFDDLKKGASRWVPESAALAPEYPAALSDAAYYGLVGEFVRLVEPHTEADPAALLLTALTSLGSLIGRAPLYKVEATEHHANLFVCLTGPTSSGRKGTATDRALKLLGDVNQDFLRLRKMNGLSSGEGLIQAVRDARSEQVPTKPPKDVDKNKRLPRFARKDGVGGQLPPTSEFKVVDYGVEDKRALVVETEFSNTLQMLSRDGNILGSVLRCAHDSTPLRVISRSNKDSCEKPHISVIGNITDEELRQKLTDTDKANGFGNRILWPCVKRTKFLPSGGGEVDPKKWASLVARIKSAVKFATHAGQCRRVAAAEARWCEVYEELTTGEDGIVGSMSGRAAAQVVRLSMLFALLDSTTAISVQHLDAALELWRYCRDSVRYIFGARGRAGNTTEDTMLGIILAAPDGLTTTDISNGFKRNKPAEELRRALAALQQRGCITSEQKKTKGAPVTVWMGVK